MKSSRTGSGHNLANKAQHGLVAQSISSIRLHPLHLVNQDVYSLSRPIWSRNEALKLYPASKLNETLKLNQDVILSMLDVAQTFSIRSNSALKLDKDVILLELDSTLELYPILWSSTSIPYSLNWRIKSEKNIDQFIATWENGAKMMANFSGLEGAVTMLELWGANFKRCLLRFLGLLNFFVKTNAAPPGVEPNSLTWTFKSILSLGKYIIGQWLRTQIHRMPIRDHFNLCRYSVLVVKVKKKI